MNIDELLQAYINEYLKQIIISGAKKKDGITKIKIRPIELQNEIKYQCSMTEGTKEIHKNFNKVEVIKNILIWLQTFKQLQLDSLQVQASVLMNKKGIPTIKVKKCKQECVQKLDLSHNRSKNYIIKEGIPIPFLIDLGVMTSQGNIVQAKYDKFKQINRFLEFIEDILPRLSKDREVTILDFGCGKSYLTFAMYYYLKEMQGYDVAIIGLDLKKDVIAHCNQLAQSYGFDKLKFYVGDIAHYEGVNAVDMVVTLHACDTATDYALAKAVGWGASVILSVPCCQHELNGQIQSEILNPVFSYGIIKERMAALYTDSIRAKLLECQGYDTQILEFIDMEHTPKNLLIRAVKGKKSQQEIDEIRKELDRCISFIHVKPTLETLLSQ